MALLDKNDLRSTGYYVYHTKNLTKYSTFILCARNSLMRHTTLFSSHSVLIFSFKKQNISSAVSVVPMTNVNPFSNYKLNKYSGHQLLSCTTVIIRE